MMMFLMMASTTVMISMAIATLVFVCKPRPRDGVIMRNSSGMFKGGGRRLMAMCRV